MMRTLIAMIALVCLIQYVHANPNKESKENSENFISISLSLKNNVSCPGGSDGSATFLIVDPLSLSSYSYSLLNDGGDTVTTGLGGVLNLLFTVDELPADDYTLAMKYNRLIGSPTTENLNFTIDEPDPIDLDLNIFDITCLSPTGTIEVITSGGTGLLSLNVLGDILDLTGTNNIISDLSEGVYTILVEDENGCTQEMEGEVENLIELPAIDIVGDLNLGCHDLLDLNVQTASGLSVNWETPNGNILGSLLNRDVQVDVPGTYVATAIDLLSGCSSSDTVEVVVDVDLPAIDIIGDINLGCNDLLDLNASTASGLFVSWGTPNGNILGSVLGNEIQVDVPGIYVATALDLLSGCSSSDTVEVVVDVDLPTIDIIGDINLGCNDLLDLNASTASGLSVSWGTANGNILGSVLGTGIQVNAPGIYVATALDLLTGCSSSDTVEVVVDVDLPAIDIVGDINLGCNDLLDLNASTASGLSVSWGTPNGNILGSLLGSEIQVDAPGIYVATALDLLTGCSSSDTVEVVLDVDLPTIDIIGDINLGCNDLLDLNASTGGGLSVSWGTPNGNILGSVLGSDIQVNAPGIYVATAIDLLTGCSSSDTVEVVVDVDLPTIDIIGDINLGCNDLLDLNASTGGGQSVSWGTPNGNILGSVLGTDIQVNTPGIYIATAVDLLTGCSSSDTVEVVVDVDLPTLDLGVDRILGCQSSLILTSVSNATSILWSTLNGSILGSANSDQIEIDAPGTYVAVAVNSLTGCESRDTIEVVEDGDGSTIDLGVDLNLTCLSVLDLIVLNNSNLTINWETIGGNILSEVNNNTIKIDEPGIYIASAIDLVTGCLISDTINVMAEIDFNGPVLQDTAYLNCEGKAVITLENTIGINVDLLWETVSGALEINSSGTSVEVDAAGIYAVVGTDLISTCSGSDTIVVLPYEEMTINPIYEEPICAGDLGSIDAIVSGGNEPYSYEWSNGQSTKKIEGIPAGTYTLLVTDSDSCQKEFSLVLNDPDLLTLDTEIEELDTDNVQVTAIPGGGVAPYSYMWSTGDTSRYVTVGPGNYDVTVTDAVGCIQTKSISVSGDPTGPCNLTIVLQLTLADSINNGTATASASGGTAPYTFAWSDGSTGQHVSLPAGQYSLTVTDANQCSNSVSFTIATKSGSECDYVPTLSISYNDTSNTASVSVSVEGASAPYDFVWSTGDTLANLILAPGEYTVQVIDAEECITTISFTIDDDEDPEDPNGDCNLDIDFVTTSVMDTVGGSATVIVSGGMPPYTYTWSTGQSDASIRDLNAGYYEVVIKDAKGCSKTAVVVIKDQSGGPGQGDCPFSDVWVEKCFAQVFFAEPEIDTELAYKVLQVGGLSSGSVFPIGSTEVAFAIQYENGDCDFCSFNVLVQPGPTTFDVENPSCFGVADGTAEILLDSTHTFCLNWNDDQRQTGTKAIDLPAGTYRVRGADQRGCIINSTVQIDEPEPLVLMDGLALSSTEGNRDGQIQVTIHGGSYPYTFDWNGPDGFTSNQEDLYNIGAGNYILTVTDTNECELIVENLLLEAEVLSSVRASIFAQSTKIYPNPSKGHFSIRIELDRPEDVEVQILNNFGQILKSVKYEAIFDSEIKIDIKDYAPGIHFVQIKSEEGIYTRKINLF